MTANVCLSGTMGVLMIAGGAMGFAKKGSKASLIAGSVFGGVYLYLSYLLNDKTGSTTSAQQYALYWSLLLAAAMGFRAVKMGFPPVPTGITALALGAAAGFALL